MPHMCRRRSCVSGGLVDQHVQRGALGWNVLPDVPKVQLAIEGATQRCKGEVEGAIHGPD